jgi:hypothetical protein
MKWAACGDESLLPEGPAVPGVGREREGPSADARPDTVGGGIAVMFERELALEGVVGLLDPLANPPELPEPWLPVARITPDEARARARAGARALGGPAGRLGALADLEGLAGRDWRGIQRVDPLAERRQYLVGEPDATSPVDAALATAPSKDLLGALARAPPSRPIRNRS